VEVERICRDNQGRSPVAMRIVEGGATAQSALLQSTLYSSSLTTIYIGR
jgi:hypothetical protein